MYFDNSIHALLCTPVEESIKKTFFTKNSSLFTPNLSYRLWQMNMFVPEIFSLIGDTFLSLSIGGFSILTLGIFTQIHNCACSHLEGVKYGFSKIFQTFLNIINPAHNPIKNQDGLIADYFYSVFNEYAYRQTQSEYFIERHINSRVAYVILGFTCILSRAADLALTIPTITLSLLTLGTIDKVNEYAARALAFSGALKDIFYCVDNIIYPRDIR